MTAPLIAVALRVIENRGRTRFIQDRAYFDAVTAAGGIPIGIPQGLSDDALHDLFGRCSGLLLCGGTDVDPGRYDESNDAGLTVDVEESLDSVEFLLLNSALTMGMPVFAICRGMQILNVALGGDLWQDLPTQRAGDTTHRMQPRNPGVLHDVTVVSPSRLATITGSAELHVNSMHHQGVRRLAGSLRETAHAPDGLVEAVELDSHPFCVGVQWHPEELWRDHPQQARLFDAFVKAAGREA